MSDKSIEQLREDVDQAKAELAKAEAAAVFKEFPKHVAPHESHVVTTPGGHVSVPGFSSHHVDREGVVTVLVHDADEEAKANAVAVKEER